MNIKTRKKQQINAIYFFLFGFLYYLISPVVSLYFFDNSWFVAIAKQHVELQEYGLIYFFISTLCLLIFTLAYLIFSNLKIIKINIGEKEKEHKLLPLIIFIIIFLFLFFTIVKSYYSGVNLFSGYNEGYNISLLGPLATISFSSTIFMFYFEKKEYKIAFLCVYIISNVFLLGMGSRMFFLVGLISIAVNQYNKNPRILKSFRFYFLGISLFLFILFIGVWRNNSEFSLDKLLGIFFAEPLFTSISAINYLNNIGNESLIKIPWDIIASALNFIPSELFKDKIVIISQIAYDIKSYSPFGASSLLTNIYINFGILFPIYIFSIGMLFGILKKLSYNKLIYSIYITSLPLLMFHFYREGFITYIKIQFFNGLIFPIFIVLFISFLLRVKQ
ncbi:oligosaccharide repeat unit polymerase [Proteus mirabilis]|uniref:O-antigen polymerase n=1 Tax=Proteus mirabilis TaxID=584 RepID=UPI0019D0C697|nr:O-antigen polymerase [Proteus mirabilis]MBI6487228.1 oligosaccharide repeat unit polymerase [Proteus mirabilis]MBN7151510.1 oligosaccharide repeat unit polymerase [Proteus mirabilis]MBN7155109.1 oligosaccharide repeat unit polymerase [Proteus mirabilis]MBN7167784.1 oligosaccharide repeat unit polymerase [Proteus mirabilis]MBN7170763.1 oligosaccharide repeat unit polymerase [Proteus mirabilis]